jgi:hypothetical protein
MLDQNLVQQGMLFNVSPAKAKADLDVRVARLKRKIATGELPDARPVPLKGRPVGVGIEDAPEFEARTGFVLERIIDWGHPELEMYLFKYPGVELPIFVGRFAPPAPHLQNQKMGGEEGG